MLKMVYNVQFKVNTQQIYSEKNLIFHYKGCHVCGQT